MPPKYTSASLTSRSLAFLTDFGSYFVVFCIGIALFHWPPFTHLWLYVAFVAMSCVLWLGQVVTFGRTWGETVWQLKPQPVIGKDDRGLNVFKRPLVHAHRLEGFRLSLATFSLLISIASSLWVTDHVLWSHPFWMQGDLWELNAFLPPMAPQARQTPHDGSVEWIVAPFFYTLGAWPKMYSGQPVLYTLPYEKGPPSQFVGHIIARWPVAGMPGSKLTFEGPHTPEKIRDSREDLKACLIPEHSMRDPSALSCLALREASLEHHLQEMRRFGTAKLSLRWFRVKNAALPNNETAQGIYLNAENGHQGEDRFVFVTANGTHQAIILDYAKNDQGAQARRIFEEAIRTVRVSDELNPGRAWVDRQLQTVQLEQLSHTKAASAQIEKLAEIQTLLLSKISVDPKTYDAYYHLGGTAMMLTRYAKESRTIAERPTLQTIQSAHRYALDISPMDPRTAQLETMWIDAKKFF